MGLIKKVVKGKIACLETVGDLIGFSTQKEVHKSEKTMRFRLQWLRRARSTCRLKWRLTVLPRKRRRGGGATRSSSSLSSKTTNSSSAATLNKFLLLKDMSLAHDP